MHARTKHVEMDYHFVCEKVARGQLVTQFVRSKDQLADIHTKALTKQVFVEFHRKLGVTIPPLISLRKMLKEADGICQRNRFGGAGLMQLSGELEFELH